jgi:hypothetical protein
MWMMPFAIDFSSSGIWMCALVIAIVGRMSRLQHYLVTHDAPNANNAKEEGVRSGAQHRTLPCTCL